MQLPSTPFHTTDWSAVPVTEHTGDTGMAYWKTMLMGEIRIRMVEYTAGYLANHWCSKGHIIFCLEGSMTTELEDGRSFVLHAGMSYQVGDSNEAHRSFSENGVKLFIVD